jgi:hypothetical protein
MGKPERRIVKPNPDGGWDIAARNAQRASAHYDNQADAIDRARQILGNVGGGELEVRGRDARFASRTPCLTATIPGPRGARSE